MKSRQHILFLRVAIALVSVPLTVSSDAAWRLQAIRARLVTKLANLQAREE